MYHLVFDGVPNISTQYRQSNPKDKTDSKKKTTTKQTKNTKKQLKGKTVTTLNYTYMIRKEINPLQLRNRSFVEQ